MNRREIERLLPAVFQRTCNTEGSPLIAILEVMAALHEPAEQVLTELDMICDPIRTPDAFVPFLARWVDLERIFDPALLSSQELEVPISTGLGRLRELTVAAGTLAQWRGTKRGLLLFLTTATGMDAFEIQENVTGPDGRVMPFHIEVIAPVEAKPHRTLLERIVKQEKPAYVTYRLRFRDESK